MNQQPVFYVAYARTSSIGQKDGETIGAQVDQINAIISSKKSTESNLQPAAYGKDGWIQDDGVSGSMLKGRKFAKLIDDLEAGRVKGLRYVVVPNLSRLAREKKTGDVATQVQSGQDWGRIKAVLRARGVIVLDKDGDNDPATVLFDLKTVLNGEEYRLILSRTMAGKARMHREGKYRRGGKPPYGYKLQFVNGVDRKNGHHVVEDVEHAANLRRILGWFVQGGAVHAATKANEAGIATRAGAAQGNGQWGHNRVHDLAKHAMHYLTGEWPGKMSGKPVVDTYPKLIDAKLYGQVERRRKEHKPTASKVSLTTGYVDCGCGAHIQTMFRGGDTKRFTGCRARCGRLREATFTDALWEMVVARYAQIAKQSKGRRNRPDDYRERIRLASSQVESVNSEIAKLVKLYTSNKIDDDIFTSMSEPLNRQKAERIAEVQRLETERDEATRRSVNRQSVEDSIQKILRAARGPMTLETKRKVLGDLLSGGRVVVEWPKRPALRKGHVYQQLLAPYASLSLPAWDTLPPVTVRTDQDPWLELHGTTRDAMDVRHDSWDTVEHREVG